MKKIDITKILEKYNQLDTNRIYLRIKQQNVKKDPENIYEKMQRDNCFKECENIEKELIKLLNDTIVPILDPVQKRCTARTITSYKMIEYIYNLNNNMRISKKALSGTTAAIDIHAQKFSSAYKYIPESTQFTIEYKNGKTYITNIFRDMCHNTVNQECIIQYTDLAKNEILEKARTNKIKMF